METTLQQQAERYLGTKILPSEWEQAKAYAVHKLTGIIEREGDSDGVRREPWYLARLIAETVRMNALSVRFMQLNQRANLQQAKKDSSRQGQCQGAEPSNVQTYCSTAGTQMQ